MGGLQLFNNMVGDLDFLDDPGAALLHATEKTNEQLHRAVPPPPPPPRPGPGGCFGACPVSRYTVLLLESLIEERRFCRAWHRDGSLLYHQGRSYQRNTHELQRCAALPEGGGC